MVLQILTLIFICISSPEYLSSDLDEPEGLLDVPADGEVVDGDLPQLALLVDHEQTSEGDPGILLESQKRHKYEGDKLINQFKLARKWDRL